MISKLMTSSYFKVISGLVAGIFFFEQVSWAGDLIDFTLEKQYVEQSQTFAPQYLKGSHEANSNLVAQKDAIEAFIRTQNAKSSAAPEAQVTGDELRIVGPKLSYGVRADGSVVLVDGSTQSNEGSIVSVTTESGDVIYYRDGSIYYIERPDGTVIQNVVLGGNNELLDADIIYPDGVILFVRGGKMGGVIDTDGTMITYDDKERVSTAVYTDGRTLTYTYIEDALGNVTETIITDGLRTAYYDGQGRLKKMIRADGTVIEYEEGILRKITDPDTTVYLFDKVQGVAEDGTTKYTVNLSRYAAKTEIAELVYGQDFKLRKATKSDGSIFNMEDGLLESVVGSDGVISDYTYDISSDNSLKALSVDRDGIKRIYDRFGNLRTLALNDATKIVYENGVVREIVKPDGTRVKNLTFRENGELDSALIAYPDGSLATYSDSKLLNIIGKMGESIDYQDGKIRKIVLADGTAYYWSYENNLVVINDVSRQEKRKYNSGKLVELEDLAGLRLTTKYSYNAGGSLSKSEIMKGSDILYTYTYTYEADLTLIHDQDGNIQAYTPKKKLSYIIDSKGRKYSYTYVSKEGPGAEVQFPSGAKVKYDNRGNISEIQLADGVVVKNVVFGTDGSPSAFTYIKDGTTYVVENGYVKEVVASDKAKTAYYASGFTREKTDANGVVTRYEYTAADIFRDLAGNLAGEMADVSLEGLSSQEKSLKLLSSPDPDAKLVLHFNGQNGQLVSPDSSIYSHSAMLRGGAGIDTIGKVLGSASLNLDGNSGYAQVYNSPDFNFGSGDFTIDTWVKFDSLASGTYPTILSNYNNQNQGFNVYYNVNSGRIEYSADSVARFNWVPQTGQWYHIALERSGQAMRFFVNGVQTGFDQAAANMTDSTNSLQIGAYYNGASFYGYYMDGAFDELRVTKGRALWTGNFNPAVEEFNGLYKNSGTYTSGVAELNAKSLGAISWETVMPQGTGLALQTRTGNTPSPDTTWSDWSTPITAGGASQAGSQAAKYIQYRITMSTGSPLTSPSVTFSDKKGISVSYTKDPIGRGDLGKLTSIRVNGVEAKIDASGLVFDDTFTAALKAELPKYALNETQKSIYLDKDITINAIDQTTIKDISFNTDGSVKGFTYIKDGTAYTVKDGKIFTATTSAGTVTEYYPNGLIRYVRTPDAETSYYRYDIPDRRKVGLVGSAQDSEIRTSGDGQAFLTLSREPDPNVTALLHLNGQDAGVALNGGAVLGIDSAKFGSSSLVLDGTDDYASIPDSDGFSFGSGDFTIDTWVNFDTLPVLDNYMFIASQEQGWGTQWWLALTNINGVYYWDLTINNGGPSVISMRRQADIAVGQWRHLALAREGSSFRIFQDGVKLGADEISTSAIPDYTANIELGRWWNSTANRGMYYLDGRIDEFRVTKGRALWTSGFTPPNEEFGGLYKGTGTFVSDPVDLGATRLDSAVWNSVVPRGAGLSVEIRMGNTASPDATWSAWSSAESALAPGRYLQYRVTMTATDDLTSPRLTGGIDFSFLREAQDAEEVGVISRVKIAASGQMTVTADTAGVRFDSAYTESVKAAIPDYIANQPSRVTYKNKEVVITELTEMTGVDGVKARYTQGQLSGITSADGAVVTQVVFNSDGEAIDFTYIKEGVTYRAKDGYVVSARKADGSITEYYSNGLPKSVTSPGGQVTNYAYESRVTGILAHGADRTLELTRSPDPRVTALLHLNGANGATTSTDSSLSNNTMTFNGGAHIDTQTAKFGSSSLFFDGSDDYVTMPDSEGWNFGSGDWTVDTWVSLSALGGYNLIAGQKVAGYIDGWYYYIGADNRLVFSSCDNDNNNQGDFVTTNPLNISANSWFHLAVSRHGNELLVFLNGVRQQVTTRSPFTAMSNYNGMLYLGAYQTYAGGRNTFLNGRLDEFRVTKGSALWTSDFTPSADEFAGLYAAESSFTSDVLEVGATALESISWNEITPPGTDVTVQIRTGNSTSPDATWSVWSSPLSEAAGSAISGPAAKYIQYKINLSSPAQSATPKVVLSTGEGVNLSYLKDTVSEEDIANLARVKVTIGQTTEIYDPSAIGIQRLDMSYADGLKEDIESNRLGDNQKVITIFNKGSELPSKMISANQTITYFENGLAIKVSDKNGVVQVLYTYDGDKNVVRAEFVEARKKLEESYQKANAEIVTQREAALAKLTRAEADARTDIAKKYADIKSQIASERVRLTAEKAKYDPGIYDLSEFGRAFAELDDYAVRLEKQVADAYVDLNKQVADARGRIETDSKTAMRDLIENDYNKILADIAQKESMPVIYHYYRKVLGRDPGEGDLLYWTNRAKAALKAINPAEITRYIEGLAEYTERAARKAGIISSIAAFFSSYIAATDTEKETILLSLGLTLDDVSLSLRGASPQAGAEAISAEQGEAISSIISWLEGQSLHFGDSAVETIRTMLADSGTSRTFEEIATDALKVEILTGVINKDTTGDLLVSMFAMRKAAQAAGLELFSEKLNFDDLKAKVATNSVIAHVDGKHYVTVTSIDETAGTVTYTDPTVGESGQEMVVSRAEFMEMWRGYAMSKERAVDPSKLLNTTVEKNIRGSGWWSKFWRGVASFFQKIIAPVASILTLIPALAPIGLALHALNIIIQTISFVAGTGTLMDVAWAVINGVGSYIGSQVIGGIFEAAKGAFGALGSAVGNMFGSISQVFTPLQGVFTFVGNVVGAISNVATRIAENIGSVINLGSKAAEVATALTTNIIATGINIGTSYVFRSMGVDPTLASFGGALFSGAVMGLANPSIGVVGGILQSGVMQGVETLGAAVGLDTNITHLAAITSGAFVGAITTPAGRAMSYDDFMMSLSKKVSEESAYIGMTKIGEMLGIDPRITSLAGIGIRSSLQAGLSSNMDPGKMWQSVTTGLLQGVTSIGINYATQQLNIPPLLANIGFSAISTLLNGSIKALMPGGNQNDIFKYMFDTFEKNTLTFLGYGDSPWLQAAYISQILDFTDIVKQRGLAEALNIYGSSFFNAVAVNEIVKTGYTLGGYFRHMLETGQYHAEVVNGKEVKAVDTPTQADGGHTTTFFDWLVDASDWDPLGQRVTYGDGKVSWSLGEIGKDGYQKMGYYDATMYNEWGDLGIWQTIDNGNQTYAEIKDNEGNILFVVEPREEGGYNYYDTYGDYVDAKISDILNGTVDYFQNSSLITQNLLNSDGGVDFGLDLITGNAVISGQSQSLVESIVNGTVPGGTQSFAEKFKYFVGTVGNLMQRPEYSAPQDISALQPYITNNFGSANNDAVNTVLNLMTQQYGFTPDVKVVYGEYIGASGGFGGVSLTAKADASLAFDGNVPSGSKGELTFNLVTGQFESGVITTTDSSGKIKNEMFTSFDLAGVNSGSTFGSLFSFGTGSSYDWNINSGLSASEAWKAESDLFTHTISFSHGLSSGASSSAWNLELKVNKDDWYAYGTAAVGALAILGGAALAATALGSEGAAVGLAGLTLAGFIAMLKTKQSDA